MNKNQIHETIMNYSWMMKLLVSKRLQTTGSTQSFIARYGDEASLPSGNDISDPVYQEMLRLERYDKNTRRIRKKVVMIQKHSKAVTDTKDQLILDGLLDGQSMREIAIELDMSLTAVKNRKDFIVNQIYQSVQNEQSEQYVQTAR